MYAYHAMTIEECAKVIYSPDFGAVPEKPAPRKRNILRLVAWLLAILHIS